MSARFLIEVPHEAGMAACVHAVELFQTTGSHFLTHADWGCRDGVHKAWMIVEVDSRAEAKAIIPALLRDHATIVQLNFFTPAELQDMREHLRH